MGKKRKVRRGRRGRLEQLETRIVLAAPVAVNDAFVVAEDQVLALNPRPIDAAFEGLSNPVVQRGGLWDSLDQIENQLGNDDSYPVDNQQRAWNEPNFDIGQSSIGVWGVQQPAPFEAGTINGFPADPPPTPLFGVDEAPNGENLVTTYLFRTTFTLTQLQASQPTAIADILCDDGCIGYVNGLEAFRHNFPAGDVTTNTNAPVGNEDVYSEIEFDTTGLGLSPGLNSLAVELHQTGVTSSDAGFDMALLFDDSVTGGFQYVDDPFGTNHADSASGAQQADGGFDGSGGLTITLGPIVPNQEPSSGGWRQDFAMSDAGNATVSLRYRLVMGEGFEPIEYSEAVLDIDGTWYGNDENNSLVHIVGDDNGGGEDDSGWQTVNFVVPLDAGVHTLTLGAYNNRSTAADEYTNVYFDDVSVQIEGAEGSILGNDTDADGDPLTAVLATPPTNGVLNLFLDGSFTYRPDANFSGNDSFTYRANDGSDDSNLATVSIQVTAVNDAPVARGESYNGLEDSTVNVSVANGVLANDTDVDSPALTAQLISNASSGVVALNADGSFRYVPNAGFNGQDSFSYFVSDGSVASNAATATINLAAVNDPPTVVDDVYVMDENTVLVADTPTGNPPLVFFSDDFSGGVPGEISGNAAAVDSQGFFGLGNPGNQFAGQFLRNTATGNPATPTTLTLNNLPAHSSLDLNFLLAIIDSWNGSSGGESPDRLNVEVDNTLIFSETFDTVDSLDQTYSPSANGILADGEPLGFGSGGANVDAAYDMSLESAFQRIPHTASALVVEFYASGAGWVGGDQESFAIDNLQVVLHNPDQQNPLGVLGNDSDPEGDAFTATLISGVSDGVLNFQSDGTFTYTPDPDFFGVVSFTYQATDDQDNESELATATITVVPGDNDVPQVVDDQYGAIEDQLLSVGAAQGVLSNDSDPDGDTMTAILVSPTTHGSLTLNPDGSFSYRPDREYAGPDSFRYYVSDGVANSLTAQVNIIVSAGNDVPIAERDSYYVDPGETLVVSVSQGVLVNDRDIEGDSLTAVLASPPGSGQLQLNPNGSFLFTPDSSCGDVCLFTYQASDGVDLSEVATVLITVNAGPVTTADSYTILEDTPLLTVTAQQGLLSNDSDANGETLTAQLFDAPLNGQVQVSSDGSFTYSPNPDFSGTDTFTYVARDSVEVSPPTTVSLVVQPLNDAPEAKNDKYEVMENQTLVVDAVNGVLADDLDADNDTLTAVLEDDVQQGNLTLNADGSFSYVPVAGFSGEVWFSYRADDGTTLSPTGAIVTIDVTPASDLVVINEIMYHPASENVLEEYIELYNMSTSVVDVTGWTISRGVDFTFPAASIAAGGYLAVAADVAAFQAKYPAVTNVVGGWTGQLSNRGEEIEVEDELGNRIDRVTYSDEGQWAVRRRGPLDNNHRGWEWVALHDGLGSSLELINPELTNQEGQNWSSSLAAEGTPGAANTVADTDIAPMILNVKHQPAVPSSTDPVIVEADLKDELETGLSANLHYRVANMAPGEFLVLPMLDDGTGGDSKAGDGEFAATIPAHPNGTVIEFYVSASDGTNNRTWPAPTNDQGEQGANLLYQVDESVYSGNQGMFRFVMTDLEADELQNINRNSDAQMNATFVMTDGVNTEVRYNAGVRVRGASSRFRNPPGLRVNLPDDAPWHDMVSMNLNTQYVWLQTTGNALMRLAGLPADEVVPIQVRLNGINRAGAGSPQYGSYVYSEVANSDYAQHHLPDDSGGNIYKKVRPDNKWDFRNGNIGAYLNDGWSKSTNASENDWSDLDHFMQVMNTASGPEYYDEVKDVVNVDQWVRWFATLMLMNSRETNLSNGTDDDYLVYRGVVDPRFILLPHDLDTIFGQGDTGTNPDDSIFQAIDTGFAGQAMPQLVPFFDDPIILSKYYAAIDDLIDNVYGASVLNPFLDNTLGGWIPQNVIDGIKSFAAARVDYVRSQIPAYNVTPVATISNAPPTITPYNSATLTVGGDDVVSYIYRLNGGAASAEFPVSQPIQLNGLANRLHTLDVIGRSSEGVWQLGEDLTRVQWTVNTSYSTVQIHEVLADNVSAYQLQGTYPDYIELANLGTTPINLNGMMLTDNIDTPNKLVLPDLLLGPGATVLVYADDNGLLPGIHAPFSLNASGEGVYLFDSAAAGGAMLDQVEFGLQLPNLSIGRGADFHFRLNQPTPNNAVNVVAPTGDASTLQINEWLAAGEDLFLADRLEVYNPDPLPVAIGGYYFSDNPGGKPDMHRVPDHSFLPAASYNIFIADGQKSQGADHLDFSLSSFSELVGLLDKNLNLIDQVFFLTQEKDVSQGRSPDGSPNYSIFSPPSLGFPNADVGETRTTLIGIEDVWRYEDSGADLGTAWRAVGFDDSAWQSGGGLLYNEDEALPAPKTTELAPGNITYYFRRHFNVPDPSNSTLQLTTVLDDGAVVYINNQEVYRIGMPAGPIDATTTANRSINEGDFEGPFTIPTDALVAGDNLIAVEAHNASAGSDIVFALELEQVQTTVVGGVPDVVRLRNQLRITEIMYHPPGDGEQEYIELQNIGQGPLNLAGVEFTNGIDFTFPDITLAGGDYILVVANQLAFENQYGPGLNVAGQYSGKLDNGGENVELTLPDPFNGRILDFSYNDSWYPSSDGAGRSLVILDPAGETDLWDTKAGWRASYLLGGSPGQEDLPLPPVVTVDSLLTYNRSPQISGTINVDTAAIEVVLDGSTYSAVNHGDGTWSFAVDLFTPLADGSYDVAATAVGLGGTGTDSTTDELVVDGDAPVVTVDQIATADGTPALSGGIDDPVAQINVTVAGVTYTATNHGNGTWSLADDVITPPLAGGTHNVCVIATDAAGNVGGDISRDDIIVQSGAPTTIEQVDLNGGLVDPPDLPAGMKPTNWQLQRSDLRNIVVTFSGNVNVSASDLRLTNLGVNAPAEADSVAPLTSNHVSVLDNVLTVSFNAFELPDGAYQLEILPTATDQFGAPIDGDNDGAPGGAFVYVADADNRFYKIAGEWNGDAGVSIFDFPTFSYWFGLAVGAAPAYLDLNRDGGISIFDFPIFSANFGKGLVYPNALQASPQAIAAILPTAEKQGARDADAERLEDDVPLPTRAVLAAEAPLRRVQPSPLDARDTAEQHASEDLGSLIDLLAADVAQRWEK